jgi:hypothetical protein
VKIELLFFQRKQARGAIYGNYAHVVEHLNVENGNKKNLDITIQLFFFKAQRKYHCQLQVVLMFIMNSELRLV